MQIIQVRMLKQDKQDLSISQGTIAASFIYACAHLAISPCKENMWNLSSLDAYSGSCKGVDTPQDMPNDSHTRGPVFF